MISLIHPSARPDKALDTALLWLKDYEYSNLRGLPLEYVLCCDWDTRVDLEDERISKMYSILSHCEEDSGMFKFVYNYGRRCSAEATNVAAAASTYGWLVVVSDDVSPSETGTMAKLYQVMEQCQRSNGKWNPYRKVVIAVDTMDQEDPTHTLTVQILNRARYEQLGYIFHPDYTSMYADDEFTRHAKKDGVLHEALHIKMRHERFERDEVYERQQGPARFAWGEALLRHREKHGFPRVTPGLESMREVVNIWNLGEGRITGDVERAIAALEGK